LGEELKKRQEKGRRKKEGKEATNDERGECFWNYRDRAITWLIGTRKGVVFPEKE